MLDLKPIPQWMQKYVPMFSESSCNSEDSLRVHLDVMAGHYGEMRTNLVVISINAQIDLLQKLQDKNII